MKKKGMNEDTKAVIVAVLEAVRAPLKPLEICKQYDEKFRTIWEGDESKKYLVTKELVKRFTISKNGVRNSVDEALKSDHNEELPFKKVKAKHLTIALKEWDTNKENARTSIKDPTKSATKTTTPSKDYNERDLHPLLAYFAYNKLGLSAKTINHTTTKGSAKSEKGKEKGKHEWLHPDMVGVKFSYENLDNKALQEFIAHFNKEPFTLVSFELKKEIKNLSDCREYYFQAISNSSWAHEGYLVVGKMDDNQNKIMELLTRLNTSFGIGVILLNLTDIEGSKVLLKAKTKDELDQTMLSELCNNKDFEEFVNIINSHHKTRGTSNIEIKGFDEVKDEEKLKQYMKEKGMLNLHT